MKNKFILIFGQCPSAQMYDPIKGNPSANRLDKWIDHLDVRSDHLFHNIIEHHIPEPKMQDVNLERVIGYAQCAHRVIALGSFVSSILTKLGIEHFKMPHPSPRNRQFNDPEFEPMMLKKLGEYING